MRSAKTIFKILIKTFLSFIGLVILYLFAAFVLGVIPVNLSSSQEYPEITIFVRTNGVHTELVLPARNTYINWFQLFPPHDFRRVDTTFSYVSFGLGERAFYIETPTWNELSLSTALKAIFIPTPSAMHVSYLAYQPQVNENSKSLIISKRQYKILIDYLKSSFSVNSDGSYILMKYKNYGNTDNFYEAPFSYHLFYTCNDWTNNALKKAGVKTALWSPFDKAIMYHR